VAEITVVGSLNLDTMARVIRLPTPGETVLGIGHFTDTGGKGANQAVAAARLGRDTAMVGMVGSDEAGDRLLAALRAAGVSTAAVLRSEEHPTGIALITVDERAENTIVVGPGANGALRPEDLDLEVVAGAAVMLLQLEIPLETVLAAARAARGTVVLNPAPGAALNAGLLEAVDVLVPNETELGIVAGVAAPHSIDEAAAAASGLGGPGAVVVTLGAAGAGARPHRGRGCLLRRPRRCPGGRTGPGRCGAMGGVLRRRRRNPARRPVLAAHQCRGRGTRGRPVTPQRIVVDTDPGQDDAVAVLPALASPELEVVAVTTVAGNVPRARTGPNARVVCELAGRSDIPVYAGSVRPMVRDLVTAEHVHGVTGLVGADLPEPTMLLQEQHAVDFLVDLFMTGPPGSVTLCSPGPLTNVAQAMGREPRIVPRINGVVMMGGGRVLRGWELHPGR